MQAAEFDGQVDAVVDAENDAGQADAIASGAVVEDLDLDMEAPIADAIEQRTPLLPTADADADALTELPAEVNPADALDQARPIGDDDPEQ